MQATISPYMTLVGHRLVSGYFWESPDIRTLEREHRRRLGVTQVQVAQQLGVTHSTVNHWENGKRLPLPFLVRRLIEMKQELDEEGSK